jgi:SAM-dependent methyltransferase
MEFLSTARVWTEEPKRRLFRRLMKLYYGRFFGRGVPGEGLLGAIISRWETQQRRGDIPIDRLAWDTLYRGGNWKFLGDLSELGHYSILVGYLAELWPGGAILDVGCGEGLLFRRFRPYGYSRYVGLDVSEAAIATLARFEDETTRFVAADAENYEPEEMFDAIVFNESLYYFHQPLATVHRYVGRLRPGGAVIVSIFDASPRAKSIMALLREEFDILDETQVTQGGKTWCCGVFAPRSRAHERIEAVESSPGPTR